MSAEDVNFFLLKFLLKQAYKILVLFSDTMEFFYVLAVTSKPSSQNHLTEGLNPL